MMSKRSATGRELLPADDPVARFVVSMSAARNAIEPALHRLVKARKEVRDPEFTINVLTVMGFLWEADKALRAYRREFPAVRKFLQGLPETVRKDLNAATGAAERVGTDALGHSRNSFFHMPHPDPARAPDSDHQLEEALADMADREVDLLISVDGPGKRRIRLAFVDEVILALALRKHNAVDSEGLGDQLAVSRDGAIAFMHFAAGATHAYVEGRGGRYGSPEKLA